MDLISNFFIQNINFMKDVFGQGVVVSLWVGVLIVVNMASLIWIKAKVEAKWALAAFLSAVFLMLILYIQFGYVRLLGLAHLVFWTPFIIYLFKRRKEYHWKTPFGFWAHALLIINSISLVIDFIDLIRYFFGK